MKQELIHTADSVDSHEVEATDSDVAVEWRELEVNDDARVGAMYCFKNCDANKN